jgi:mannose-6-phosphate isomerase-like protein (cupin superfamily)
MNLRRVVIATNDQGASDVLIDGAPPRQHDFVNTPGFSQALVWATPAQPAIPYDGVDPTPGATSFIPEVGGTRFIMLTFPPDTVYFDPSFDGAAAGAEALQQSPGIAELFEPDAPGMHTTPTVDYDIVLDGEVWLELADGREVKLSAGDVVVQHGARHAWRNKSDRSVTIAAILIGASTGNNQEVR